MTVTKKPNLLIVGAPKCGTTSLYYYLKQHPEIFMCPLKEPDYFSQAGKSKVKTWEEYIQLFKGVKNEKVIGEASPDYLCFYKKAIPLIKEKLGDPKIIILLRNPIERAYSSYLHMVLRKKETASFMLACKGEERRKKKCPERVWYIEGGMYYEQVKAYKQNFSSVKIIFFEEFIEDVSTTLSDVYNFLHVSNRFPPRNIVKFQSTGVPRNKFLHILLTELPLPLKSYLRKIIARLGMEDLIRSKIEEVKSKNLHKPPMGKKDREFLKRIFQKDVELLSLFLGVDLKEKWLNTK